MNKKQIIEMSASIILWMLGVAMIGMLVAVTGRSRDQTPEEYMTDEGTLQADGILNTGEDLQAEGEVLNTGEDLQAEGQDPTQQAAAAAEIDPKTAYLTFDDGPSYLTPKVLDVLDEYGVKATFFVTYQPDYADLYQEIVDRGHAIGVHSASHKYDEIYASFDNWLADFTKMYDYIYEQTGVYPTVYRFPGGSYGDPCQSNPAVLEQAAAYLDSKGMAYFDWNVTCGDGGYVSVYDAYKNVVDNIQPRHLPVIIMHDGVEKENTLAALPDVLKQLQEWGYTFKTLSPQVPPIHQGSTWDY
jgi:peptidoglycan/xylan/chitin deacetylase (PgdA/CDA1 family)